MATRTMRITRDVLMDWMDIVAKTVGHQEGRKNGNCLYSTVQSS